MNDFINSILLSTLDQIVLMCLNKSHIDEGINQNQEHVVPVVKHQTLNQGVHDSTPTLGTMLSR